MKPPHIFELKVLRPSTVTRWGETGRVLFKTIQGGSRAALESQISSSSRFAQSHTLLFRFRCAHGCTASYLRGVQRRDGYGRDRAVYRTQCLL